MINILVTGGAGFIGSHTVVSLIESGFNPIIIDNFSNAAPSVLEGLSTIVRRPVTCYQEDCNDIAALRRIFEREQIQGVIHFAAFKAVGESMAKPLAYYHNNIHSLTTLLEVMQAYGVKPLIFSSSCTVYGEPDQLPVTESAPIKAPQSVYGNTKQIGEAILQDCVSANMPFQVVSLRYFNPIGAHPSALIGELPNGVPNNLVPYITQTAAGLREKLTVFGDDYPTPDGTCIRDFIHVMDLAEAHVAALQYILPKTDNALYEVVNVGTGQGASVLEIIHGFERVTGKKLNYTIGPRRPGDVVSVYADAEKAEKVLGWRAQRSLDESLSDAWRWQERISRHS